MNLNPSINSTSSYLSNLKKAMCEELDIPDPNDLLAKQFELENKSKQIELEFEKIKCQQIELNKKEKELIQIRQEINLKLELVNKKEKEIESKSKLIICNNMLPKVAEKQDLIDHMIQCATKNNLIKENTKIIDKLMINDDEYIVYNGKAPENHRGHIGGYNRNSKLVITNFGKVFFSESFKDASYGYTNQIRYYYVDFEIILINKLLLQGLINLTNSQTVCENGFTRLEPMIGFL